MCYYDDILDQYTVGMNWMYEEFGYVNKIGWATDSFGHSHSQVALEHLLGFEFQGIERVDDRYIHQHKPKPLLEFYWQPVSDSNGKKYGGLLNHVRHFLHEVNDLRRIPSNSITVDFRSLENAMKPLYNKNKFFRFLGTFFFIR